MAPTHYSPQPPSSSRTHTQLVFLAALLLLLQTVHAIPYTLRLPTAATRWTIGGQGTIVVVSTDKAPAAVPGPTYHELTVSLRKKGFLGISSHVADIGSKLQLLIPADAPPTTTEVVREILWPVPIDLAPGSSYFVRVSQPDAPFLASKDADSPDFNIVAGLPPGTNTTTPVPTPTATATTAPPTPTSTLPAGQTCNDIQQQCVAQARIYNPPSNNTPCSCGDLLPQPTVRYGTATASIPLPRKTSSGAAAAFVILVMALVGMF